jgi:hypothetical protein
VLCEYDLALFEELNAEYAERRIIDAAQVNRGGLFAWARRKAKKLNAHRAAFKGQRVLRWADRIAHRVGSKIRVPASSSNGD